MRALFLLVLSGCLITTTSGDPQPLGVRYRCEAVTGGLVFHVCEDFDLPAKQHAYPCDCEVVCREDIPTTPCLVER
jgi:hypothetical protein